MTVAVLLKNVLLAVPLAPFWIGAAASDIDAAIQKRINGSETITLVISNKEINGIIKIFQTISN